VIAICRVPAWPSEAPRSRIECPQCSLRNGKPRAASAVCALPVDVHSIPVYKILLAPDSFKVDEFANTNFAQFAPIAGVLHAPERQPRIGCDLPVYKHLSRFDAVDELFHFAVILSPNATAKPEGRIVRYFNSSAASLARNSIATGPKNSSR
jgi:hypothetical protein